VAIFGAGMPRPRKIPLSDQANDRVHAVADNEGAHAFQLQVSGDGEDGRTGRRRGTLAPSDFRIDATFIMRPALGRS